MKLNTLLGWVLVLSAVLWGYAAVTGTNLLGAVLGAQLEMIVELVVGVVGVYVGYLLFTGKASLKLK